MKKKISAAMILLAMVNLFAICATTISFAGDMQNVVPVAPQNVAAVNTAKGVSVTWEQVKDTAGYKIYRCTDGGEYEEIGNVRGFESDSFTDATAKSGNTYIYTVKAYNAYNEGELSEESTVLYLKQPTLSKVSAVYGGIELKWSKSAGAEGYTVYRKSGKTDKVIAEIDGDGTITFKDTNVKDGKKYTYTVIAHSGIYRSSFAYKTSKVYVTAPKLSKAKIGNGSVTLTWEKTKTADKYRIYRKTNDSSWENLKTVKKDVTSFKDTNVKNGVKYTYTVRSIDGGNSSGYNKDGLTAKYVSTPENIAVKNSNNQLNVTWSKVSKVSKYRVYRKDTKNTSWEKIAETTSTKYKDSSVKNGTEYTYTVRAVGENGGVSSYLKGTKSTALNAPATVKLSCTTDGVKVSWTKMNSGTGYRVYRKLQGDTEWKLVAKIKSKSTASYTDTAVKSGKTYSYTVRQVKGNILGSYDKEGVTVKYVAAPKVTAKHSPKGIVLTWNKSVTGTGYEIQRKAQGESSWKTIKTINKLSTRTYTDSKPVYGKKNNYRILVKGTNLVSSAVFLYGIDPNKKMVALTYDDGPYTPVTNQILDVLEENNARATFFVVGSRVSTYKDCIKREAELGCEIANHTYNHTILTSVSASTIKSEISKTNNAVKKITGQSPALVRAPGGSVNSTVKKYVEFPLINWSVDTLDWKNRNSSSVVSSIKNNVRDGSIVLMHDLYGSTGDATEEIVPWLIKKGYQLVTVSEMMAVKGIEVKEGELYTKAY